MGDLFCSIIISTRNRSDYLKTCLHSIKKQEYSNYEVIIVDESDLKRHKLETIKLSDKVKALYIEEKRKGVSIGHNTGIKSAKGQIIAITDDDCIADKKWLTYLVSNFGKQNVMCVTGRTKSYFTDKVSNLMENLVSFDRGSESREFDRSSISISSININILKNAFSKKFVESTPAPWGVGYGNNIAYRKVIFKKVGYFDESLGRGTKATGGDDTDLIYRILKNGYKAVYEPKAIIFHKHRESYQKLMWDVCHSNGIANYSFLSKYFKNDPYSLILYLGGITHLLLVILNNAFKRKQEINKLTILELLGWLNFNIKK